MRCGARSAWLRGRASSLCLILALLWALLGTAAGSTGCGGGPRRRLLQEAGAPPPLPPASNPNGTNGAGSPVIETVEVDVVSQECVILSNAYYEVDPSIGVLELIPPSSNLQNSARDCCASCHDFPAESNPCTAFQWCPSMGGCFLGAVAFPYRGCQLIDITGFLNTSINTGQIKIEGPDVAFTSGSPLFFSVPKLSGYDVEIGRNFGGKFSYSCPGSLVAEACVLEGSAQVVGRACNDDPDCLAFSFYPKGTPMLPNAPSFGVLKGGKGASLSSADTELNPNAAIYIKLEPFGGSSEEGGSSSSNTVVIAAVVGSVLGTAAVAMAVLSLLYLRYRRLKASVPDDRKPPGTTAGMPEDGEAGGLEDEVGSGGSGPLPDVSSAGGGSPVAGATPAVAASSAGGRSLSSSYYSHDGGGAEVAGASSTANSRGPVGVSPQPDFASIAWDVEVVQVHGSPPGNAAGTGWEAVQTDSSAAQHSSLFVPLDTHAVRAGGAPVAAVDVSLSSSGGSSGQAAAWYAQQYAQQWQQQQQQQYQPGPQANSSLEELPVVVEVARAVAMPSGGRGDLPPSLQQAGTARELLEVFARMYSQRPAVDYAVVAEMLDQDADPSAVCAAESADEDRLRQIDAVAAQQRAALRGDSAPVSSGSSTAVGEAHAAAAAAWQQQQQQQHLPAVSARAEGAAQGPAAVPGSAQMEQEQSLLPGMISPVHSMLPPVSDWSLQPEEIEICKRPDGTYWQLGTGAFGTCYKGLYHGQQLVAVKVLHRVEERRRNEEFEREVALLKDLRDRNIVQFIGACLDGPTPMLVTEFLEFGDLWRALPLKNAAGQRIFAWHKRGRHVLYDVAKGLHYLHQRRIVHLDLKSANILLSRHGTAKICDIGMARVLGNKEYLSMLSGMGTFAWSAPEVLSGKRCTEKVDLYSFGVVIWEVCTGDVPVRGEMRPLVAPADCPPEVVDLHERCVSEQPEARPTAAELLELLESLL